MSAIRTAKTAVTLVVVLLTATALCFAMAGCSGDNRLRAPVAEVSGIIAEPDYTVTLAWSASDGADSYDVEYEYGIYPGDVHSVTTGTTSVTVKRVKGELKYRVRAVAGEEKGEFSEWLNYDVPELELDALRTFNIIFRDGKYYIDVDTFEPVTYLYKGERKTVNYYEFDLLPPDSEDTGRKPQAYSLTQIREGFAFNIGDIAGVWRLYARPALYVDVNGVKDYSQVKELNELYSSEPNYIIIEITV